MDAEPSSITLTQRLAKLAGERRPALVSRDVTLSYDALTTMAGQTAELLSREGIRPGDRVGLASRDGIETILAMFGIWSLGACAVPLDFRSTPAQRGERVAEFGLAAVVADRASAGGAYAEILVDDDWRARRQRAGGLPPAEVGRDAPALISLTSGTGGAAQGIVMDHDRLARRLVQGHQFRDRDRDRDRETRFLSAIPLSYSASRNHLLAVLLSGGTVHFHPPLFRAQDLAETILRDRITDTFIVPTIARGLLDLAGTCGAPLFPDMRRLSVGGASLEPEEKVAVQARVSAGFCERYSSSLTGNISTLMGEDVVRYPDSAGRVLTGVTVEIEGPDGHAVRPGQQGLIRVRSPMTANGFTSGSGRDGSDRLRDGWAYPGDIGRLDADGALYVLGRQGDMILRGGATIYPAEVERALADVTGVREIAVTGFSDPMMGQEIAAFYVADDDGVDQALRQAGLQRLPSDRRPRV